MKQFSIKEIAEATGGKILTGNGETRVKSISTDSRTAKDGDMFFPLVGRVTDGHKYLAQVLENGCRTIVLSKPEMLPRNAMTETENLNIIQVDDTTDAMGRLARYYLDSLPLKKKIAVTGSVGKTSTRDMLYAVAATTYKTARSIKNFNNEFGLPLSILEFPEDTEIAVLEMGMSVKGSIARLADLTEPDMAVITNVLTSHLENFPEEGRDGIFRTKMEVVKNFGKDSVLIVNGDNDMLAGPEVKELAAEKGFRLLTVKSAEAGAECDADYKVSGVIDKGDRGIEFDLESDGLHHAVLDIPGAHNALNASLAIAMGNMIGIPAETCIEGLKNAELTGRRLKVENIGGIKVIDDTYNAAPASTMSAISTLMATEPEKRHVAFLGTMRELGPATENGHRQVGAKAAELKVDVLVAVGESADFMADEARKHATATEVIYFATKDEAVKAANDIIKDGDVVLVKASNTIHLDAVIDAIRERDDR